MHACHNPYYIILSARLDSVSVSVYNHSLDHVMHRLSPSIVLAVRVGGGVTKSFHFQIMYGAETAIIIRGRTDSIEQEKLNLR